jgi:hypothetical protein
MLRLIIVFLVFTTALSAQYRQNKSYLSLSLNTGIGSDWLSGPDAQAISFFNEYEIASLSYGACLNYQYEIGRKSLIEVGLNYQRRSVISREQIDYPYAPDIDPYYGFVRTPPTGSFRRVRANHYAEIPMRWTYFLNNKREAWRFSVGLIPIYEIGFQYQVRYGEGEVPENSEFYASDRIRLQLQALLGAGYRWFLSDNWFLDAGIQAQHSISPSRIDVPNKHYHWLVATEISLIRSL